MKALKHTIEFDHDEMLIILDLLAEAVEKICVIENIDMERDSDPRVNMFRSLCVTSGHTALYTFVKLRVKTKKEKS